MVLRVALHPLDDAVHHRNRLDRVAADGGLGRQHHGIGTLVDGGGDVRRFGAGGRRRPDHGVEPLGGDDHRLAGLAAVVDDLALQHGHVLRLHLHAEVAARHHDGVGLGYDILQLLDGRRLFQLGHQTGAALGELAGLDQVFRPLDERQRHPVDPEIEGEFQVLPVFLGQGRDVEPLVGQVDALPVRQPAADGDPRVGRFGRAGLDRKPHLAVVEQQIGAGPERGEHFRMGERRAAGIARNVGEVEPESRAGFQMGPAFREVAQSQLRPLKVDQDADRVVPAGFDGPDGGDGGTVSVVLAVAEIQPEDVRAGFEQRLDGCLMGSCRTERRNDLGVAVSSHGSSPM